MQEKDPAGRLFIHNEDIKKTNVGQIWTEAGLEKVPWISESLPSASIIGNLPFNISTYLITRYGAFLPEPNLSFFI
jgi:16S rRNA A1518/A1519 N6-dimethyltransferase RsmA/KsgA/DIM1 with predicted DNA glycosylase/AP lyase activity